MADSIKEGYREFLEEKGLAAVTVGHYIRALVRLEEKIKKSIYNLPLPELETLRDRMLVKDGKRGDLYKFNQSICNRSPSAAVRQLIEYKQKKQSPDTRPEKKEQSPDALPESEQQISIKEDYKRFLDRTMKNASFRSTYPKVLEKLEVKTGLPVYDLSIPQLKKLYNDLLTDADLKQFNMETYRQGPSAAVRKLIKYKQGNQFPETTLGAKKQISIEEGYKNFLDEKVKKRELTPHTVRTYTSALKKIEKLEKEIKKPVYNLSITELEDMHTSLLKGGDLYEYYKKRNPEHGEPTAASSAVRQLIEYKQKIQSSDTPPPETEEQIESYSIEQIIKDGCFLEEKDIKKMLEQIKSKKNLILQGPPGTGKTWLAKKLAFAFMRKKNKQALRTVQFHPNLSYEDFVQGYRPDSNGILTLADGLFLKMINQAKDSPDTKYIMVIEEINRGNPVQIFGEMLTLLEADKRKKSEALELSYHNKDMPVEVYIPDNVYVIGTMNIADRSLASLDLALRRRFAFYDLKPTFGERWQKWVSDNNNIDKGFLESTVEKRLQALNTQIANDSNLGAQFQIGHSYVTPSANEKIDNQAKWFRGVVESQIIPLLKEYWLDTPKKVEEEYKKLIKDINDRTNN